MTLQLNRHIYENNKAQFTTKVIPYTSKTEEPR